MGWLAHGGSHMRFGSEETMRHAEWMTDRLMSDVNASAAQKTKARGIADAAAGDLQNLVVQHRENRKALVAMLKEPTLDRNKLEALRAGSLHSFDEASKRIATAMGDLADVLTPAQRLQLAESMEKRDRF